jgi:hypothetical protein
MATAKKSTTNRSATTSQTYEVLLRSAHGRETIVRVQATSPEDASTQVVDDHGVDQERVVEANPARRDT